MNVRMDVQLTLCNETLWAESARKLAQAKVNSLHVAYDFRFCDVFLIAVVARVNFSHSVFVPVMNVEPEEYYLLGFNLKK